MTIRILLVMGTRPEAIKLAPVYAALTADQTFAVEVCVTAQHREMLDDVLELYDIAPNYDLDVMKPNQDLYHVTTAVLAGLRDVLGASRPDWMLVQGDTTTTFAASLAAFYEGVAVGHVEAGLRTWDRTDPYPEEMNRVLTARLANLHFAPTPLAADNLRREGCDDASIVMTGNTVVDALFEVRRATVGQQFPELPDDDRPILLTTMHRRENYGDGVKAVTAAVREIALTRRDWCVVWPVHPNPNIKSVVNAALAGIENVHLLEPLRYDAFVNVLDRARLVLTDSGGVQEEAASIGKPVLILRRSTERPEAVAEGAAQIVPTNCQQITAQVLALMDEPDRLATPAGTWYGDGTAALKIRQVILDRQNGQNAGE